MEVCIYSLNPSYWRGMEVFNIGFIGGMNNFFLRIETWIFDMTDTLLIDLQSYWLSSSCL